MRHQLTATLLTLLAIASTPGVGRAQGPCGVPLPDPGGSVVWDLANGPYTICQNMTVPAGGAVLVEPGVTVTIPNGVTLTVQGTLVAQGSPGQTVHFEGAGGGRMNVSGTLDAVFTDLSVFVLEQASGSTIRMADSTVGAATNLLLDQPFDGPMLTQLERCVVNPDTFRITGEAILRDVTFNGSSLELTGYSIVEGLESSGSVVLYADYQDRFVDDVAVSGAAGAGLEFRLSDADGGANLFVGSGAQLTGNGYPLHLEGMGLLPGSSLPLTGNVNDSILGPVGNNSFEGDITWPDVGLPYTILGTPSFSGAFDVRPGVTVLMGPSGRLMLTGSLFDDGHPLRGLPGSPIRFLPLDPAAGWLALVGGFGTFLFEHLEVEGAQVGVSGPQATIFLKESEVRQCQLGLLPSGLGVIRSRGTRFLSNAVGAETDASALSSGGLDLVGLDRPNVFAGNGLAIDKVGLASSLVDARGNWWGDGTGPFHPGANPGGQGDPIDSFVQFEPWLAAEPDLSDAPPVVRISKPFFVAEPGSTIVLAWDASDDGQVVSQSILLDSTGGGPPDFQPVAAGLAGDVRSFEWTVPDIGFNVAARPVTLRIEAVDDAGNTSFDQVSLDVPEKLPAGSLVFDTDLSGSFRIDEEIQLCWTALGVTSGQLQSYLLLEGDERVMRGPQGTAGSWCYVLDFRLPDVSTDTARFAVLSQANGNRDEWYFSEPFTIRPNPLLGDAPPTVQMTSPLPGESFAGGGVVPIAWSAGDDEGLRAFKIQASFDGARTWHTVERDLPGTTTWYDWQLPSSAGVADVRVRVIAVDQRFQNSSDGADVSFSIEPGQQLVCQPDLGFGGPGTAQLSVCGEPLTATGTATVALVGAAPAAPAFLLYGAAQGALPLVGGTVVPVPTQFIGPFPTDAQGELHFPITGIGVQFDLYVQFAIFDQTQPESFALSNAVQIQYLP